jgi:5-methylcytosine-specific restriction endonuclease McrA
MTKRKAKAQGMNWIRPEKRLALYLRDGLACAYCGAAVEDGAVLTLDHLVPYAHGGANEATNLVTACRRCNSARGTRALSEFAEAVARYLNHDRTPEAILAHVGRTVTRPVDVKGAKALMAARGGFRKALKP